MSLSFAESPSAQAADAPRLLPSRLSRPVLLAAMALGAVAGSHAGIGVAEADLTRLLRAMAVLKLPFVAAATGAILWRLQAPIRPGWLAAYAAVSAAMVAGPALIWFLSHLVLASILLHVGFAAAVLLLWRDGVVGDLLQRAVARRRGGAGGCERRS